MIDYRKLKIAHELIEKNGIKIQYHLTDWYDDKGMRLAATNIESLINMIKEIELNNTESRYKIGSTWWYLDGPGFESYPEPKSLLITKDNAHWHRQDEEWFPSKQALIESQIAYWESLQETKPVKSCVSIYSKCHEEFVEECQHASDSYSYITAHRPQTHSKKCIKCGEFYK